MSFHVNTEGEVGRCTARIACPFGDFESQHYPTEADARAAYEAAMRGTSIKVVKKDLRKDMSDQEKFLDKLRSKAGPPPFIQPVPKGYYESGELLNSIRRGDELYGMKVIDRATISEDRSGRPPHLAIYLGPKEFSHHALYHQYGETGLNKKGGRVLRIPLSESGKFDEGRVWIDDHDPELILQRKTQADEYAIKSAHKAVLGSISRLPRTSCMDMFGEYNYTSEDGRKYHYKWSPRKVLSSWARWYGDAVKDAEKAGVANPAHFALSRLEAETSEIGPYASASTGKSGQFFATRTLTAILKNDDTFRPNEHERRIIRATWPEGKRPFIDYMPGDLGFKHEVELLETY